MVKPIIQISQSGNEMKENLKVFLEERIKNLQKYQGVISIGVSGGSMPQLFCDVITKIEGLEWQRIRIFQCDERFVPSDHPDSNYGAYRKLMPADLHYSLVPVPIKNSLSDTAKSYELLLRKVLLPEQFGGCARFDILLLGVGPDGHTCSIFPNKEHMPNITEYNWVSIIDDSPKPPPMRVTLTMNVLNHAKNVAFIITGKAKSPIVRGMVLGNEDYPACRVQPINNKLWYFLDSDAASDIPSKLTELSDLESPEPIEN